MSPSWTQDHFNVYMKCICLIKHTKFQQIECWSETRTKIMEQANEGKKTMCLEGLHCQTIYCKCNEAIKKVT